MNPVLLLEINEVPWRVFQHYSGRFKNIDWFFKDAAQTTTLTVDEGELSPWVTWPSLHRGLPNTQHRVFNLGQDPKTFQGTPIWQDLLAAGESIGIFGSMQSWPPVNPGPKGFFIPDTFAHDARCIPEYVEPLQRFNLDQVSENARVVSSSPIKSALKPRFAWALARCGVSPVTIARLGQQIVRERLNPDLKARRPIFQTVLFWDVFKHLFKPNDPPALTTFFTNHIAGVMHRYWNHIFPDDFPGDLRPERRVHHETMDFAMSVLDDMLADVRLWLMQNPKLTVVLATSMGQAAVFRTEHHGQELTVRVSELLTRLRIPKDSFKPLLAMTPQVAVEIPSAQARSRARSLIEDLRTSSGKQLFQIREVGASLSITNIVPDPADFAAAFCTDHSGALIPWADLGIAVVETDRGTAYHIPEGVFAAQGALKESLRDRLNDSLPADQVKPLLLELMKAPPTRRSTSSPSAQTGAHHESLSP